MNSYAIYDGLKYKSHDPVFLSNIQKGHSEPYPKDLKILKKYLQLFPHKTRTVLDIGGHIGTTSLPYSRIYNKVITYEPNKNNYELLLHNININDVKNIEVHNNGAFNKTMKCSVVQHEGGNSGCFYIKEDPNGQINTVKLDEKHYNENIDFIKIDTEGSELHVLEGCCEIIKKHKPLIQIETNDSSNKYFNYDKKMIYNFLENMGYILFDNNDDINPFFYCPNDTLSLSEKMIYGFWTNVDPISEIRMKCIIDLEKMKGSNFKLIKIEDVENYILQSQPLHPAFKYLSSVHKSDYLRTYFMNFYGGGYADIKSPRSAWSDSFDDMLNNSNAFANSYHESGPGDIAYEPHKNHHDKLIGNCAYIMRPYTEFTRKWYAEMISLLDAKLEKLQRNPARSAYDMAENGRGYPIEWNEMLGRIFHKVSLEYVQSFLYTVPTPIFQDYR